MGCGQFGYMLSSGVHCVYYRLKGATMASPVDENPQVIAMVLLI
jgi:hypothetical protein